MLLKDPMDVKGSTLNLRIAYKELLFWVYPSSDLFKIYLTIVEAAFVLKHRCPRRLFMASVCDVTHLMKFNQCFVIPED